MMDKLVFNDASYDVAVGGLNVTESTLIATLVSDDFDGVEASVAPVEDIVQELEDGTKIASYIGYTKLNSVEKKFNQVVDQEASTHEETRPKINPETGEYIIDPETGKIETETVEVTDYTPIYADVLVVTLLQPTLENVVTEQGEEIEEIQEVIMEIIEA